MKKNSFIVFLFVVFFFSSVNLGAVQEREVYQYVVKIICGLSEGKIIAQGRYFTAINLHNPSDRGVSFRYKVAVALPGTKPGPVSKFVNGKLEPDQASEIDCPDIFKLIESREKFLKGFVVIESEGELDVVVVYTVAGSDGYIETMDIERINPQHLLGCPDLIVERIEKPIWDNANKRSVIRAIIKNIGNADAVPTLARVIDPSTPQDTGAPYNDVAMTPGLPGGGGTVTITFYLPYWVYNPDVTLEVTADYKNQLQECNENNNKKIFKDIG
jgi:hypothetical protein